MEVNKVRKREGQVRWRSDGNVLSNGDQKGQMEIERSDANLPLERRSDGDQMEMSFLTFQMEMRKVRWKSPFRHQTSQMGDPQNTAKQDSAGWAYDKYSQTKLKDLPVDLFEDGDEKHERHIHANNTKSCNQKLELTSTKQVKTTKFENNSKETTNR
eukprot:2627439-Amphidinium_carterae.2